MNSNFILDDESDYKLSAILRKSCNLGNVFLLNKALVSLSINVYITSNFIDRSYHEDDENSEDYEEYDGEDSKAYSAYKRKLIKDLEK